MTDTTETPNVERHSSTHYVYGGREGVGETGEGSLLAQTRNLVEAAHKPKIVTVDIGGEETALVALKPDGEYEEISPDYFDGWRSKPLRLTENPTVTSLASLIDYTNRFKGSASVVFASDDRASPSISTVLDYHLSGPPGDDNARHGNHVVNFPVPLSDEWKAWTKLNGQNISMPNFARFLEDHIVDVLPQGMIALSDEQERFISALGGMDRVADPAKLMELASGLQVFTKGELQQAQRLASGEAQLTIREQHVDAAGQQLVIPSTFVIAIPVFRNGDRYQILVRLRYRATGEGVVFFYELWRNDLVFDHAFDEAVQKVGEETSLPVFRGSRA